MYDSRAELAQAFEFTIETRIEEWGTKGVTLQSNMPDFLIYIAFLHIIVTINLFLWSPSLFNLFEFRNTVQYDLFICLLDFSSENKLIQESIHLVEVKHYIQLCEKDSIAGLNVHFTKNWSLSYFTTSHTSLKYSSRSSTKRWIVSINSNSLSVVSTPKTKYRPAYLR